MQLNKTIRVTFKGACGQVKEESIQWFIEDQAFSPSNDLAPSVPPSPVSKLAAATHRKTEKLRQVDKLLTGEWERGRGEQRAKF